MPNASYYDLATTIPFEAPNHRDLIHEEIHQRLGGAGFISPPPPLGSGSDDRAQLLAWLTSGLPANSTIGWPGGHLLSAPLPLPAGHKHMGRGVAEAGNPFHFTLLSGSNPSAATTAVLIGKDWDDNNTFGGAPTIFENLAIDCNAPGNTGTYSGIIPFSFWTRIRDCRIDRPRLHHVLLTRQMKNGTEASIDFADNRIHGNRFRLGLSGTDGAGIRHFQPGGGGNHNADIRAWDNHMESMQHGILADSMAGWTVFDNHMWCQRHGINVSNGFYDTRIWGNYVDAFGVDNTAGQTYYGLRVRGFDGPNCIVFGNHVDSADTVSAGTHYCYMLEGQNAGAHITGGFNEASAHSPYSDLHAFVYTANAGQIINGQFGNQAWNFAAGKDFETILSGGGTILMQYPRMLTGTGTLPATAVAAGANTSVTITVTGAVPGDPVDLGWTPALATLASWRVWWAVTANDTVTAVFENRSGASITPAATTVRAKVTKYSGA